MLTAGFCARISKKGGRRDFGETEGEYRKEYCVNGAQVGEALQRIVQKRLY